MANCATNTSFTAILPVVYLKNKRPVTTSRDVASYFDRQHYNVMRDIDKLDCSKEFNALNFEGVGYVDSKGEHRRMFEMTKNGFTFLAMGFTGAKAAAFKEAYIKRFDEMAMFLEHTQPQISLPVVNEPIETYMARLATIRECRLVHGARAAAKLWQKLDLPNTNESLIYDYDDAHECLRHLLYASIVKYDKYSPDTLGEWIIMKMDGRMQEEQEMSFYGIRLKCDLNDEGIVVSLINNSKKNTKWTAKI